MDILKFKETPEAKIVRSWRSEAYWKYACKFTDSLFDGYIDTENIKEISRWCMIIFSGFDTLYEKTTYPDNLSKVLLPVMRVGNLHELINTVDMYDFEDDIRSQLRSLITATYKMMDILKLRTYDVLSWRRTFKNMYIKYITQQANTSKVSTTANNDVDARIKYYLNNYSATVNLTILVLVMYPILQDKFIVEGYNPEDIAKEADDNIEPMLRLAADMKYDPTETMSTYIYALQNGISRNSVTESMKRILCEMLNDVGKVCRSHLSGNCLKIAERVATTVKPPEKDELSTAIDSLSLKRIKKNETSISIYDTAFLYTSKYVSNNDKEKIFAFIKEIMLEDGSWGTKYPEHYGDRIVSTLAVLKVFASRGETFPSNSISYLKETIPKVRISDRLLIGFEIIVDRLLSIIDKSGYLTSLFDPEVKAHITRKVKYIEKIGFSDASSSYYLEVIDDGDVHRNLSMISTLTGTSPSSLVTYLNHVDHPQLRDLFVEYMKEYGLTFSTLTSIDIFEVAWSIKYLNLIKVKNDKIKDLVNIMWDEYSKKSAVAYSTLCTLYESDCSSVVLNVLISHGKVPDVVACLKPYYTGSYFKTFVVEDVKSVTANAHVLEVLNNVPEVDVTKEWKDNIIKFLIGQVTPWKDKWHVSVLYATCEIILSLIPHIERPEVKIVVMDAIGWIVVTQRDDGGWTACERMVSTIEETCYAVIMLDSCFKAGLCPYVGSAIKRGLTFLKSKNIIDESMNVKLWISKVLYSPVNLIRALYQVAITLASNYINL